VAALREREPTERQAEYLDFIRHYSEVHGRPPSEGDIVQYFGVSAPAVHQMILTLEARGFLARSPRKARTIRVLVAPTPRSLPWSSSGEVCPPTMTGQPVSAAEATVSVGSEVLSRVFAHYDRCQMDDSEFAPLVGCLLDGVDSGLRAAGLGPDVAGETRRLLLEQALRAYAAACARNDPCGADAKEDGKTFLYLMKHGHWPGE
jgi:hypothetical protein